MINILTGFFSGIISGMGIGGGAILIPALIFIEKIGQQTAQGINLTYFIPTAVFALFVHIKNKSVRVKTALILGGCGVLGALLGAWIATAIDGGLLRRMFGGFLLFVGVYEILKGIRIKSC
ncbi:MAG: sulfite exporter TauE/SafE family protein [Clostridia bacterium]|nr:sulfite exporter TauE/SafE family protein [Clostridia bacterium]MBR6523949.1 sulfite exporter TauE/SafE family protein [Clostridia bacterium]